jgi:agmatine/peptidylarginine deiminase
MKHFYFGVLFSLFLLNSRLAAQEVLPKGLTAEEESLISSFEFTNPQFTPAPELPVRTAAQWEEVEYLLLRWTPEYQNIQRQIVEAAITECKVLITTQNQASVESYLTSNGIDLTNVEFLNAPSNSIWIRDYSANTVYTNDVGELAVVDWIYNRPRPLDNVLPSATADYFDLPIYITDSAPNDLVNTGGNFMSDGMGNAFASKLILDENDAGNPYGVTPKTEEEVDEILHDYMGINSYWKMETLPYDGIHHIDMHMKLLDEETLLVSQYPEGVADGPQIEENINYITSTFQTPFGNDYDVVWIPAPPSSGGQYPDSGGAYRTYTNALILNKTVLVPVYRPEVDAEALQIWHDAMPGYRIVGIDVDNPGENLINLSGAIHCITHTIGVADPLWIVHEKIREVSSTENIPVEAQIKHISGIDQAKVFWKEEDETTFHEVPMTNSSEDNWVANLTVPADSEEINYYIWAEANSGKSIARPMPAPDGYWTFNVLQMSTQELAEHNIQGPFPNPAKDQVHFNFKNIQGKVRVSIYNILGEKLFNREIENADGRLTLNLNPSWNGVYLVNFEGDFGKVTRKLLVK